MLPSNLTLAIFKNPGHKSWCYEVQQGTVFEGYPEDVQFFELSKKEQWSELGLSGADCEVVSHYASYEVDNGETIILEWRKEGPRIAFDVVREMEEYPMFNDDDYNFDLTEI